MEFPKRHGFCADLQIFEIFGNCFFLDLRSSAKICGKVGLISRPILAVLAD